MSRSSRISKCAIAWLTASAVLTSRAMAGEQKQWWTPYSPPCVERENVFAFTEKPSVKSLGNDRYEITFAVKSNCDVAVGIIDPARDLTGERRGAVVRHLGAGVLGPNAPGPFQKNSLKQTICWDGKDDLGNYVKEPEKLKARVMLGLTPEFHRNMGSVSMYDMPCRIQAVAADKDGVYVFSTAHRSRTFCRKFGHDAKYICSLVPPPANLPESKLQGMGYIEYEPGKRAIQAVHPDETMTGNGVWLPEAGGIPETCQPAVINGRIYYMNSANLVPSYLYYINTDGSTELAGCSDRPFIRISQGRTKVRGESHNHPRLAASPDGKWIYMVSVGDKKDPSLPVVWRCSASDAEPAKAFIGNQDKPGADNASLNGPCGIDTDPQGRIYVCDRNNQRLQVFAPDGRHLQTIKIEAPSWVGVHRKTGAVYVLHEARVSGRSVARMTKHSAFPELKKLFHFDGMDCEIAALDSWSEPARIWVGGGIEQGLTKNPGKEDIRQVEVWEEQASGFRMILSFEEEAKKAAGSNYMGRWSGSIRNRVVCDPTREQVYLSPQYQSLSGAGAYRFDIPSGRLIDVVLYQGMIDDAAFDKKGYLHAHMDPGFFQPGVVRFDPDQIVSSRADDNRDLKHLKHVTLKEVPYDYGVVADGENKQPFSGVLDVRDQPGSKYFQDGMGVNMRGDIAVESNIYYVPKGSEIGQTAMEGENAQSNENKILRGKGPGMYCFSYNEFLKQVQDMENKGKEVYFIPRQPGVPLAGATVWTYDHTGELREKCAVVAGNLINGVQIDEDGRLYFTVSRQRLDDRKVFLAGRQGVLGGKGGDHPYTGTFIKSGPKNVRVLVENSPYAPVPLEQKPNRPPEVGGYGTRPKSAEASEICWVENAEWFYAGASPIVCRQPCSCPTMRCALDWYKRAFVIEQYRHSFGVLDSNGNLILHMGRYGNRDSGDGPASKIPVGGDNIAVSFCEFVSATDNYVCYDDNGERLAAVKLNYHAEETVGIGTSGAR